MITEPYPSCTCPMDSKVQSLSKINNNLVIFLYIMSSGNFTGNLVNVHGCLCSEAQILTAINNNLVAGLTAIAGGIPVDPNIDSWSDLAAVPTVDLEVGAIKIWVDAAAGLLKATQLLAATDATDTASGIQRPNDYSASNQKVWFNKLA